MNVSSVFGPRLAGVCAIGSGVAYLAYLFVGPELRDAAITAWNVLIIPAAIQLGMRLAGHGALLAAGGTAAGLAASLLWAFSYDVTRLELWWLGLAAAWWLGVGWLLRRRPGRLGAFTLILGVAATIDFVLTLFDAPMPIYALGGFKIPLTIAWTFWVGAMLLRDPALDGLPPIDQAVSRWAGAAAAVGGVVWAILAAGWTFGHGSTQAPRHEMVLELAADQFTGLFAVPAVMWAVSLGSLQWDAMKRGRLMARLWLALAVLGTLMIGLGAVLQVWVVDPNVHFDHPAVQAGFLLFVGGLAPVLSVGALGVGLLRGTSRTAAGRGLIVTGLLAPLPVLAFALSAASAGDLAWDIGIAALHAAPGLGWLVYGSGLLGAPSGQTAQIEEGQHG